MSTLPQFKIQQGEKLNKNEIYQLLSTMNDAARDATAIAIVSALPFEEWKRKKAVQRCSIPAKKLWAVVLFFRRRNAQTLPIIRDENNQHFSFRSPKGLQAFLHHIDMNWGKRATRGHDKAYVVDELQEEALASSKIEGASTTHARAREMLATRSKPRDRHEHMIMNNYLVLKEIEEHEVPTLTPEVFFRWHAMLLKNTSDDFQGISGRLRYDQEDVAVSDDRYIYHRPPKADFVQKAIPELLDLANGKPENTFLHPLIRACAVHFWVGYLHPFVDGNGRLARALFSWVLWRHGYPLLLYAPVSRCILESKNRYGMAFVHTEQDSADFTYFLGYMLEKFSKALMETEQYLKRSQANEQMQQKIAQRLDLSVLDIRILMYLQKKKPSNSTLTHVANIFCVSMPTVIASKKRLLKMGFIAQQASFGRSKPFVITKKGINNIAFSNNWQGHQDSNPDERFWRPPC